MLCYESFCSEPKHSAPRQTTRRQSIPQQQQTGNVRQRCRLQNIMGNCPSEAHARKDHPLSAMVLYKRGLGSLFVGVVPDKVVHAAHGCGSLTYIGSLTQGLTCCRLQAVCTLTAKHEGQASARMPKRVTLWRVRICRDEER